VAAVERGAALCGRTIEGNNFPMLRSYTVVFNVD